MRCRGLKFLCQSCLGALPKGESQEPSSGSSRVEHWHCRCPPEMLVSVSLGKEGHILENTGLSEFLGLSYLCHFVMDSVANSS
jgi:hypothetical protein